MQREAIFHSSCRHPDRKRDGCEWMGWGSKARGEGLCSAGRSQSGERRGQLRGTGDKDESCEQGAATGIWYRCPSVISSWTGSTCTGGKIPKASKITQRSPRLPFSQLPLLLRPPCDQWFWMSSCKLFHILCCNLPLSPLLPPSNLH